MKEGHECAGAADDGPLLFNRALDPLTLCPNPCLERRGRQVGLKRKNQGGGGDGENEVPQRESAGKRERGGRERERDSCTCLHVNKVYREGNWRY